MKYFKIFFLFFIYVLKWNFVTFMTRMPQNTEGTQLSRLAVQGSHLRLQSFSTLIIQSRTSNGSMPYLCTSGLISQMFFYSRLFFLILNLKFLDEWKAYCKPKPISWTKSHCYSLSSTANELLWFAPAKESGQREKPHRPQVMADYFLCSLIVSLSH